MEITGQSEAVKNAQALEMKREEEMTDAFGNTVKVRDARHDMLVPCYDYAITRCCIWLLKLFNSCGAGAGVRLACCLYALQIKQPKKTLSNKEKKKKERLKAARKKAGETVSDSEEDEW